VSHHYPHVVQFEQASLEQERQQQLRREIRDARGPQSQRVRRLRLARFGDALGRARIEATARAKPC
jgi:hypothetical protein